ncbi:MAG: hypothetical protein ACRD3W_11560, partial [Terriglobales bacterium]
KNAAAVKLEVTRPNAQFEWPNAPVADRNTKILAIKSGLSGAFVIKRHDFPDTGLFELRVRAVDAHGRDLGVASDHIVAAVDP